jgi:hypothetical protein
MTEGIVTGGWEFVWAAYGLTAAVFVIYAISVFTRLRSAKRNAR